MNRNQRAQLAQETLEILRSGVYSPSAGREISIGDTLRAACTNTILYTPDDEENLLKTAAVHHAEYATCKQVSNRTTFAAAHSLREKYSSVACLNFASAKNPGGGFLSGSQAQEESLARASGLYASLQTQPEFYAFHRQQATCMYSHRIIYSPQIPVFRDDGGHLLEAPWTTNIITAAAVNAGAVRRNEPAQIAHIIPTMKCRARMALAVAAAYQCEALVLGAWGCGVFQNDPATIARIFREVLNEPLFEKKFAHVEFAVYDASPEPATYRAFAEEFDSRENG